MVPSILKNMLAVTIKKPVYLLYKWDEILPNYIGIIISAFVRIPSSTNQDDARDVSQGFEMFERCRCSC